MDTNLYALGDFYSVMYDEEILNDERGCSHSLSLILLQKIGGNCINHLIEFFLWN